MPRNKLIYSKELDHTYILGPDGKTQIGSMTGDQRQNPLAYGQDVADAQQVIPPYTKDTNRQNIEQMGKDFVVNAASQAPLMLIPGAGLGSMALRMGGSLAAGYGADRLLNPQVSQSDSAGNAALNTVLGEAIPWLMENKIRMSMPGMKTERTSVTSRDPTLSERTSASTRTSTSARSGTTSGEGTTSGTSVRDSSHRAAEFTGPHTQAMSDLEAEISKLKERMTNGSNWTKSNLTAFDNAISKNQTALDALNEANSASGFVSHSEGSTTGKSARTGSSEGSSESKSSGITNSNSITTPGETTTTSTSRTTGHSLVERVMEMIQDAHVTHTKNLSSFAKFLAGFLPNSAVDATVNKRD